MTLSERNTFFKAGIAFCAVCTLLVTAASIISMPLYQGADLPEEITCRPSNIFNIITGMLLENNFYAVNISLLITVVFSLASMILIHYFFERTSAQEILYIAIFIISFSFEIIRFVLPLREVYGFPSVYMLFAARILLFIRYFGIFSLFAASVCSAGLEVQKIRNVIFVMIVAALIITFGVPIDVLSWDTSLNIVNGYGNMFRLVEVVVFFTTFISFLITAKNKDSKEYIYVAIGVIIALLGRSILLHTDNWIGPFPGIFLLSFGIWVLCSKLHKINLWL